MSVLYRLRPTGDRIRLRAADARTQRPEELARGRHMAFYQSGTAALAAALHGLIERSDISSPEVLIPAYTCPDLISAVVHAGARARLVDFEADRPWMAEDALTDALSPATVAVIAVNFLGIPERLDGLQSVLSPHGIPLIYDCAQSFIDGTRTDTVTTVLSFGRGKPVALLGGGAVVWKDGLPPRTPITGSGPTWRDSARFQIRAHLYNTLARPRFYWLPDSLPWLELGTTRYKPLGTLQPAPPQVEAQLAANVDHHLTRDRRTQALLRQLLADVVPDRFLDLPAACGVDPRHPLLRYPLLCESAALRERAHDALNRAGMGVSRLYEVPLNRVRDVPQEALAGGDTRQADDFADRLLTLPTHEDVRERDVRRMADILRRLT